MNGEESLPDAPFGAISVREKIVFEEKLPGRGCDRFGSTASAKAPVAHMTTSERKLPLNRVFISKSSVARITVPAV